MARFWPWFRVPASIPMRLRCASIATEWNKLITDPRPSADEQGDPGSAGSGIDVQDHHVGGRTAGGRRPGYARELRGRRGLLRALLSTATSTTAWWISQGHSLLVRHVLITSLATEAGHRYALRSTRRNSAWAEDRHRSAERACGRHADPHVANEELSTASGIRRTRSTWQSARARSQATPLQLARSLAGSPRTVTSFGRMSVSRRSAARRFSPGGLLETRSRARAKGMSPSIRDLDDDHRWHGGSDHPGISHGRPRRISRESILPARRVPPR